MAKKLIAVLLVLVLTFSSTALVFANETGSIPPLYSRDYFFDLPDEMGFSLSRDGLYLYYLANQDDAPVHNIFRMFYALRETFFVKLLGSRTLTRLEDFERPLFDTAPLADWVDVEIEEETTPSFSQADIDAVWAMFFELDDEEHISAAIAELVMFGIAKIYIITPGDTLSGIAHEHNVSVTMLLQANNIDINDAIYAGQQILVPVFLPSNY